MGDYPTPSGRANHPPEIVVVSGNTTGQSSSSTLRGAFRYISAGGAISAGISNNALQLNVPIQSAQPAVKALGVSNTGNTAGNTGTSSGIIFVLAVTNGITASQSTAVGGPNTIWLSGNTGGGGVAVADINGNTISNNTVVFSNSNGVSFGLNGSTMTGSVAGTSSLSGTGIVSISVNGSTISIGAPNQVPAIGVSNTGNTAGNTGTSFGVTYVFAGTNGITASQSTTVGGPNTIWLAGNTNNYVGVNTAQTNVTWTVNSSGISLNAGGYAGTNTAATNASVTLNTSGISVSVAAQSVNSINISAGASSANVTAVTFSNVNGVTFGYDKTNITASVNTSYLASNASTNYVQANAVFNGTNVSGTIASNAISVSVSPALGTNTALTANGVSMTANTSGISLNVPAFLTTADLSQNSSKYAGINGAITGGSITVNTSGVSVNLPAYLTTAMQSGASTQFVQYNANFSGINATGTIASNGITVSVGAGGGGGGIAIADGNGNTVSNSTVVFSNNNGVSFGLNGSTMTGSVAGTSSLSGTGIVSISVNGSTISIGASQSAQTQSLIQALYDGHNSITTGTISLASANGVTFSINGQTLSASVNTSYLGSNASTNYVQANATIAGTNITGTIASNGMSLSVAGGGGGYTNSFHEPVMWNDVNSATATAANLMVLQPFTLNNYLSFGQINMVVSVGTNNVIVDAYASFFCASGASLTLGTTGANSCMQLINLILFSRGTGNNTDNLFSIASTQNSIITFQTFNMAASASASASSQYGTYTGYGTYAVSYPAITSATVSSSVVGSTSSWTTWGTGYASTTSTQSTTQHVTFTNSTLGGQGLNQGFTNVTSLWTGNRMMPFQFATSLPPGEYWLGILSTSSISSSSSSSVGGVIATSNTYTANNTVYNNITISNRLSYAGSTATLVNSLGWFGGATAGTMAPSPGHGSFNQVYYPSSTYVNNAHQPNGAIAFSQINTDASFFRSWLQFASNRI